MLKFLLDENLSHETAEFLRLLGGDVKTAAQFGLKEASDVEIAKKAAATRRIIVTLDLDFGEMFYFGTKQPLGIIVLRLRNQTVESVNANLKKLLDLKILNRPEFRSTLIIVEEGRLRVRRRSK